MASGDRPPDSPDLGIEGTIDPTDPRLVFAEDPLSRHKIAAVRPFVQELSDGGGQPIRVVLADDGGIYLKQGNHRVYAARLDGLRVVGVRIYNQEQWEASFEQSFERWGNDNPGFGP